MSRIMELLGELSTGALVVLVVLAVLQLILQAYSLIDLMTRPRVRGGKKWVWLLVIAAGSIIGAIAYLTIGRSAPAAADGSEQAGDAAARERALDQLYGKHK